MKKIAFFCIPAHGHTNPMLPVARELIRRGNQVRFYSFLAFQEKIEQTGAAFLPCDRYLPALDAAQEARIKKSSTTEMTLQDLGTTRSMTAFLEKEMRDFQPDVIYTDSVCFWGKLTAQKFNIPMVVSTSTFAFNQLSSQYMKSSPAEMADRIFGLPKMNRALRELDDCGYHTKSILSLVMSDNSTDSVVYTSENFQPYGKGFSEHYAFVGPSVFSEMRPQKEKARPLIYISLGTVVNDRPDFYNKCMEALRDADADVVISCGTYMNQKELTDVPENIKVYPSVDQLEVLSRADVFLTHCGMNSVSESLFMATPMVLYPQTGEQAAVARRAAEIGAGIPLKDDSVTGIRKAVQTVLQNSSYAAAASVCSREFRACGGPAKAAEFIENAPHHIPDCVDPIREIHKKAAPFQLLYWGIAIALLIGCRILIGPGHAWIIGLTAGLFNGAYGKFLMTRLAARL